MEQKEYLFIEDRKVEVKYPASLRKYLNESAKKVEMKAGDTISKLSESLIPLIPIAVGLGVGALTTWAISREQKAHIIKEYL